MAAHRQRSKKSEKGIWITSSFLPLPFYCSFHSWSAENKERKARQKNSLNWCWGWLFLAPVRLGRCVNLVFSHLEGVWGILQTLPPPLLGISNPSLFQLVICDFFWGIHFGPSVPEGSTCTGTKADFCHVIHLGLGLRKHSNPCTVTGSKRAVPSQWPQSMTTSSKLSSFRFFWNNSDTSLVFPQLWETHIKLFMWFP